MKSKKIVEFLKQNKIVALPTDTVYGFFALPTIDNVKHINNIKNSKETKKLTLMSDNLTKFLKYIEADKNKISILQNELPGKKTFIINLKNSLEVAKIVPFKENIGIRIPTLVDVNTKILKEVLSEFDFLLSTSVNLSGKEPLNSSKQIKELFGDDVVVVKEEKTIKNTKPSMIIDLTNGIELIRS